jgi:hypothetical protein
MRAITMKDLEWVHDCVLMDVIYDASSDAGRLVKWRMRCPHDLGYTPWDGKEIVLLAADVPEVMASATTPPATRPRAREARR